MQQLKLYSTPIGPQFKEDGKTAWFTYDEIKKKLNIYADPVQGTYAISSDKAPVLEPRNARIYLPWEQIGKCRFFIIYAAAVPAMFQGLSSDVIIKGLLIQRVTDDDGKLSSSYIPETRVGQGFHTDGYNR
jgi:hypothetical protein